MLYAAGCCHSPTTPIAHPLSPPYPYTHLIVSRLGLVQNIYHEQITPDYLACCQLCTMWGVGGGGQGYCVHTFQYWFTPDQTANLLSTIWGAKVFHILHRNMKLAFLFLCIPVKILHSHMPCIPKIPGMQEHGYMKPETRSHLCYK